MYARDTSVSVERTEAAIKKMILRYGATSILCGWSESENMALVGFQFSGLPIKILLPLPDKNSDEFTLTGTGRERNENAAFKAWEQACRTRWRALLLIIKAKLEAIEIGMTTAEKEFMADLVLPNGDTMFTLVESQIQKIITGGKCPQLQLT